MASNTNSAFAISLSANNQGANAFSGGPFWSGLISLAQSIPTGNAAGQNDLAYFASRTVASATADPINLFTGLVDALGVSMVFVHVTAVLLYNNPPGASVNTTALTLGGGSNPFLGFLGGTTPTIGPIQPGGFVFLNSNSSAALGTISSGTNGTLTVTNATGASNTYQIGVIGRSA
jgi:hypothetical protein